MMHISNIKNYSYLRFLLVLKGRNGSKKRKKRFYKWVVAFHFAVMPFVKKGQNRCIIFNILCNRDNKFIILVLVKKEHLTKECQEKQF